MGGGYGGHSTASERNARVRWPHEISVMSTLLTETPAFGTTWLSRRLVPPYRSSPATMCPPLPTSFVTAARAAMPLVNDSAREPPSSAAHCAWCVCVWMGGWAACGLPCLQPALLLCMQQTNSHKKSGCTHNTTYFPVSDTHCTALSVLPHHHLPTPVRPARPGIPPCPPRNPSLPALESLPARPGAPTCWAVCVCVCRACSSSSVRVGLPLRV